MPAGGRASEVYSVFASPMLELHAADATTPRPLTSFLSSFLCYSLFPLNSGSFSQLRPGPTTLKGSGMGSGLDCLGEGQGIKKADVSPPSPPFYASHRLSASAPQPVV